MSFAERHGVALPAQHGAGGRSRVGSRMGARAMLSLALPVEIYLCVTPTDMRKSFDGLWALAVEQLRLDPFSGGLFVFVNRRRDRMKLLYWDVDGLAVWAKRLESGSFQLPEMAAGAPACESRSVTLTATELTLLLRGIDLRSVRQRKRYRREVA
jgi:transposase